MSLLIKNALLVDGAGEHGRGDVLINNGKIASLSGGEAATTIDGSGFVLTPALFDPHSHLRSPGQEVKEDLRSGLLAAAKGGYAAVVAMPNTEPAIQRPEDVRGLYQQASRLDGARLLLAAALTEEQQGRRLTPAGLLRQAGAVLLSDDGRSNDDAGVLARGLLYAAAASLTVAVHAEDTSLRGEGLMNDGALSAQLGIPGNPAEAETARIARDLEVLRWAVRKAAPLGHQVRLYVQHVSSKRGAELIEMAHADKLPVYAEVTPHHLTLTAENWRSFDPVFKVAPPLREPEDVDALLRALESGVISSIGSDHAPHTRAEKERDLQNAPFGIPNIEVAFPLLFSELVDKRGFPLAKLIARMSDGPREALGMKEIRLRVGEVADLMLFDPGASRSVDPATFLSKARYSPWQGWRLKGWPLLTLLAGKEVWRDAALA